MMNNLGNDEKRNKDPCSSNPATGNAYVVTPIEVVQKAEHYEPINRKATDQTVEKERTGFWHSIFGEKKCKNCSRKKSKCACQVKKKKNFESKFGAKVFSCEQDLIATVKNPHGHGKEIIQNSSGPAAISLPIARRGCGCQFYFCIDNKRPRIKNKNAINQDNEKIKSHTQKVSLNLMESNNKVCNEDPTVTIVCEAPTNGSENTESNSSLRNNNYEPKNDYLPIKNKYADEEPERRQPILALHVLQEPVQREYRVQNDKQRSFSKLLTNNEKKEKLKTTPEKIEETLDIHERDFEESSFSPLIKHYDSTTSFQNKYLPSTTPEEGEGKVEKENEDDNKEYGVEGKKGEIFPNNVTAGVQNIYQATEENRPWVLQDPSSNKTKSVLEDKDRVTREFEILNRTSSRARKSSLFIRNSLISLRKQQKQSQLESRVSQIFTKLTSIDHKLSDLEKKCINKNDDNITMGISCSNKKSTISIKFNREKEKDGDNIINLVTSPTNVKSEHQRVSLRNNYHGDMNERPSQKHQAKTKTNPVVHHNSHELDAHRISLKSQSNTGYFKCVNPKIIIECPTNNHQTDGGPVFCDKWRRVSEELKISKPDVTTNKLKCPCKNALDE